MSDWVIERLFPIYSCHRKIVQKRMHIRITAAMRTAAPKISKPYHFSISIVAALWAMNNWHNMYFYCRLKHVCVLRKIFWHRYPFAHFSGFLFFRHHRLCAHHRRIENRSKICKATSYRRRSHPHAGLNWIFGSHSNERCHRKASRDGLKLKSNAKNVGALRRLHLRLSLRIQLVPHSIRWCIHRR